MNTEIQGLYLRILSFFLLFNFASSTVLNVEHKLENWSLKANYRTYFNSIFSFLYALHAACRHSDA